MYVCFQRVCVNLHQSEKKYRNSFPMQIRQSSVKTNSTRLQTPNNNIRINREIQFVDLLQREPK